MKRITSACGLSQSKKVKKVEEWCLPGQTGELSSNQLIAGKAKLRDEECKCDLSG